MQIILFSLTLQYLCSNQCIQAAKNGEVPMNQTELYMKLSERTRVLVQEYFDLPKRLNFAFTHLVCRHALADGKCIA